jgi:ubiquinol oxidase
VDTVETLPHHVPQDLSDRFALATTRLMRGLADLFFAKRYGHRAVVLETVAAVPGLVGATATHLQSLRLMVDDGGWIRTLMATAVSITASPASLRTSRLTHRSLLHSPGTPT